jgi:hypothetical protein
MARERPAFLNAGAFSPLSYTNGMTDGGENPESSWLERNVRRLIMFLFPRDPSKQPPPQPAWDRFYQKRQMPFGGQIVVLIVLFGLLIYAAYMQAQPHELMLAPHAAQKPK